MSPRGQIEKDDMKDAFLQPDTHIMPEIFQQLDFPFERLHLLGYKCPGNCDERQQNDTRRKAKL